MVLGDPVARIAELLGEGCEPDRVAQSLARRCAMRAFAQIEHAEAKAFAIGLSRHWSHDENVASKVAIRKSDRTTAAVRRIRATSTLEATDARRRRLPPSDRRWACKDPRPAIAMRRRRGGGADSRSHPARPRRARSTADRAATEPLRDRLPRRRRVRGIG